MNITICKPRIREPKQKIRCKSSAKSAQFSYNQIVNYQLSEMEKREKDCGYIRPDEVNLIGRVWRF